MNNNAQKHPPADEISIRNLVLTIRGYILLLLARWYLILPAALVVGGYQYYKYSNIKPTYPAKVVLLVRPQEIAKESKVLIHIYSRLINSKFLLKDLLLERVDPVRPSQLIINYYLDTYYTCRPETLPEEIPKGFFFENNSMKDFTPQEQLVFKLVLEKITTPLIDYEDGFVSISIDESVGFITLNAATPTEKLTLLLIKRLQNKAEKLLMENAVFAPKYAYNNMAAEADSLERGYKDSYYALNRYRDRHLRLLNTTDPNPREVKYLHKKIIRLEAQAEIYKTNYLASLEQLKVARVDMDNKFLLIQTIEETFTPIDPYRPSAYWIAFKSATTAGILAALFLIIARIYQNIVEEQQ